MKHPTFKSIIKSRTKALLDEYLLLKANRVIDISKATGLSPTWISMFSRDMMKHTDVGRVETLHDHLSKKSLADYLSEI